MSETVAESAVADPRIGTTIAGYRIVRLLGRGGMSTVYLAEDLALGRNVALKLLSTELSEDEAFRARFRLESRLAASIDHPHVIPIHEAGQADDGTLFIVMRFVDGADLRQILKEESPLDPDRAVELLIQTARGLDAAHAAGLVHRDVKPSNVLVARSDTEGEHVYLADFGLTKSSLSPEGAKESITLSGSSDYVSPEQIEGTAADPASDIYAFGCVAYECLTGEVPYPRSREMEVLFAHIQEDPPRPSVANPALSQATDGVIARAMAKEPAERYASGSAVVDAIRGATARNRRSRPRTVAWTLGLLSAIAVAAVVPSVLLTGNNSSSSATPALYSATIETVAGTDERRFAGDGGKATDAAFVPRSIAFDSRGNLYVADGKDHRIRRIDEAGVITTFAGTGVPGATGDGGLARDARIAGPDSLAFDAADNLFFVHQTTGIVRRIGTDGVITTIAGNGDSRPSGRGLAADLRLSLAFMDVDSRGAIYLSLPRQHRILRIDPDGGYVTIAGDGSPGYAADGRKTSEAEITTPVGVLAGPDGSVHFFEGGGARLRRIAPNGELTTTAGTGIYGYSGDGGPATAAQLTDIEYMAFDTDGNLFLSDTAPGNAGDLGNRVRRIGRDGIITTVAGTGDAGFSGDGGPATGARLNRPAGLAFDRNGDLYLSDEENSRIRRLALDS